MTRLSVGLLSSASYLPCPFRKDPRTLKRGSLGTGGRRVATKPTPSPSASSNWAVVYRSFLPFHFFLSLSFFCLSSSLFSRFFHFSLSLSLIFHLASTAIHLRRVLPEILFSQPLFNGQPLAFFLSLSLSRLCLYLPVNVFASSREDSFFRRYARFLPPVNPPASTPRLVYGETWRRGSLSSRLSSGIAPFLRVVTSASSNICEKNIRSKYLNEDGGAWTSLLSFCLSFSRAFGIMSGATSWWFIEKVFRIFWGIVRVWLGIGSNYYAYSFIRCFEWYSQLDENNLSNLK